MSYAIDIHLHFRLMQTAYLTSYLCDKRTPFLIIFQIKPLLHHLVSRKEASCLQHSGLKGFETEQPFSCCCFPPAALLPTGHFSVGIRLHHSTWGYLLHPLTQRTTRRVAVWHHSPLPRSQPAARRESLCSLTQRNLRQMLLLHSRVFNENPDVLKPPITSLLFGKELYIVSDTVDNVF